MQHFSKSLIEIALLKVSNSSELIWSLYICLHVSTGIHFTTMSNSCQNFLFPLPSLCFLKTSIAQSSLVCQQQMESHFLKTKIFLVQILLKITKSRLFCIAIIASSSYTNCCVYVHVTSRSSTPNTMVTVIFNLCRFCIIQFWE